MNKEQHAEDRMRNVFSEAHRIGAEEFGGLWLSANENAVLRVSGLYDTGDMKIKTLMAAVILSTLRTYRAASRRVKPEPRKGKR